MKKYIFISLFTILLVTSDSLWACAESLMQQPNDRKLRDFTPRIQNMLSIASLIAYVSGSQTVSAEHITLATLTTVSSSNKEINRLNVTDTIHEPPTLNTLSLMLKDLNILKPIQEFLLSRLKVQIRNPISSESRNGLLIFELKNDLLILHLGDLNFIPTLTHDESAIALIGRAIYEAEKELIYRYSRYGLYSNRMTLSIPITEEHFFFATLSLDTDIRLLYQSFF